MCSHYARRVYFVFCLAGLALTLSNTLVARQSGGGIVESAMSSTGRSLLDWAQLRSSLPKRGPFIFPAPYSTLGVRLTNEDDCRGGIKDCVLSVGYSYWRNMNNHVGSNRILIALSLDPRKGGTGPTLFSYDKVTGATANLGALFPASSPLSSATGEGWYFSATLPNALYVNSGTSMYRYDVIDHTFTTVVDASQHMGEARGIWQMQSSNDDAVHSFTVRNQSSKPLGCGVYSEPTRQFRFFAAVGEFDECQVDKSGRFLVIKENVDGTYGLDNRVIDLATNVETLVLDQQGALGHSDLGYGYGVGEDNWNSAPGAVRVWDFTSGRPIAGRVVFQATDWAFGANHISHENAKPGVPLDQQIACSSNAHRLPLPRANEVVCYRLDGSFTVLVVAPVMTNLDAPGGGNDDYTKMPKGNLDVTGQYYLWTSNVGGDRQDAFIVRVPVEQLMGGGSQPVPGPQPSPTPAPTTPAPAPSSSVTQVEWTNIVNASVTNGALVKTKGCRGCADAGATSKQQLAGDGFLEVVVGETSLNRVVGLSRGNSGTSGDEIQFGLRIHDGLAEVREYGSYRGDTRVGAGDRLTIEVGGGTVSYAKNDAVFLVSGMSASFPLIVDTSLNDIGAAISSARLSSSTDAGTSGNAAWINPLNVAVTSASIQKVGGCDGCPDASVVSAQVIERGNASVEFTAGASGLRFVGLIPAAGSADGASMPFSFRIDRGNVEVREAGSYRAETRVTSTDRLRIAIVSGQVQFSKNDVVIFTSTRAPEYPMRAAVSLYAAGAAQDTPRVTVN